MAIRYVIAFRVKRVGVANQSVLELRRALGSMGSSGCIRSFRSGIFTDSHRLLPSSLHLQTPVRKDTGACRQGYTLFYRLRPAQHRARY
ncbi:hypothetical protein D3C73_1341850 [compost metagenome]